MAMAGCSKELCRGTELAKVKTAAEEKAAMHRFWKSCRPLTIRAMDAKNRQIPFSDPHWQSKVHHIQLSGGASAFDHTVIDAKNVLLMMGE